MSRGQTALPAGQPPGVVYHRWRSPGWAGELNCPKERRPLTPAPGSRRRNRLEAARALTGRRSFSSGKRLRVQPAPSAPERLAAWPAVKSLPMTINDRGRNLAQAGRALHAPAEARRAFRDLAKSGGSEAAGVLARSTGRGPRSI